MTDLLRSVPGPKHLGESEGNAAWSGDAGAGRHTGLTAGHHPIRQDWLSGRDVPQHKVSRCCRIIRKQTFRAHRFSSPHSDISVFTLAIGLKDDCRETKASGSERHWRSTGWDS